MSKFSLPPLFNYILINFELLKLILSIKKYLINEFKNRYDKKI